MQGGPVAVAAAGRPAGAAGVLGVVEPVDLGVVLVAGAVGVEAAGLLLVLEVEGAADDPPLAGVELPLVAGCPAVVSVLLDPSVAVVASLALPRSLLVVESLDPT